jgi:hypothetical protein
VQRPKYTTCLAIEVALPRRMENPVWIKSNEGIQRFTVLAALQKRSSISFRSDVAAHHGGHGIGCREADERFRHGVRDTAGRASR